MGTVFGLNVERKKHRRRDEATMQAALIEELRLILPENAFVFAVPNGGSRNVVEAVNLKRQGVVAGVPDLIVVYAGRCFGLELKTAMGKLSDNQRITFHKLTAAGMRVEVVRSREAAISMLREMGIPLRRKDDCSIDSVFGKARRRA